MGQVTVQEKFFPPCPLKNDLCWAHQREVDMRRADFCPDIEWEWRAGDKTGADIGVHGLPEDCCHCLLTTAHAAVLDLVGEEHPCVSALERLYSLMSYALGADRRVVVEVSSPTKPPWWPVRKGLQ